jgi:hypothetical protein
MRPAPRSFGRARQSVLAPGNQLTQMRAACRREARLGELQEGEALPLGDGARRQFPVPFDQIAIEVHARKAREAMRRNLDASLRQMRSLLAAYGSRPRAASGQNTSTSRARRPVEKGRRDVRRSSASAVQFTRSVGRALRLMAHELGDAALAKNPDEGSRPAGPCCLA